MPELPEVETIKRQLNKEIRGKKIKNIEVRLPRLVKCSLFKFKKAVLGAAVKNIKRRAKLLLIELSSGYVLVIHLKMSGQIIYQAVKNREQGIGKHTHLVYTFFDNSQMLHNDMRQFGYVKLVLIEELPKLLEQKENYGPEPLSKEFSLALFKKLLSQKPRTKIKPLLMDQTFVAGIGNVYSDEILFYARVQPHRQVKTLKSAEIEKIYQGTKLILSAAIHKRGTSTDLYVDAKGRPGNYLPLLKVYGREGQSCFRCQAKIVALKIGGRTAHFCPKCQK